MSSGAQKMAGKPGNPCTLSVWLTSKTQNKIVCGLVCSTAQIEKPILARAMEGHKEASDRLKSFHDDEEVVHMYDIIGRTYGILPSEVAKLSWVISWFVFSVCARGATALNVYSKRANERRI